MFAWSQCSSVFAPLVIMMVFTGSAAAQDGAAPSPLPAPDMIGYVVEISGDWVIAPTAQTVRLGAAVAVGSRLERSSPEGAVKLGLMDGSSLVCPGSERCAGPLARPPGASTVDRLLAAVGALFESPERFVPTMSRGDSGQSPVDAVLCAAGKRIDVAPALTGVEVGTVDFALQPVSVDPESVGAPAVLSSVTWRGGAVAKVAFSPLPVGLQELSLKDGGSSWVYLAGGDSCAAARAAFGQATTLAAPLGSEARSRLLRATLFALATRQL